MGLTTCPDCGTEISELAELCPKCARPFAPKKVVVDKQGAWCPHCGNRNSTIHRRAGCAFWFFVFWTLGLVLIFYPWLPKYWTCLECKNDWKA